MPRKLLILDVGLTELTGLGVVASDMEHSGLLRMGDQRFETARTSIVEAEADHRELFRDCSVGGRLVSALQRRPDAARSCDPAAPEGTDSSNFDYALGLGSELGK